MGSDWFRTYTSAEGRPVGPGTAARLVCFPHAGGAASAYVRLARRLAPDVEVLSVQYPGRQDRRHEEPVADIGRLADALAEEVVRHVPGSYAFFGHSMGALVAHETARRLHERGAPAPARLFLSARGAPGAGPGPHDRIGTDAELLAVAARLGGTASHLLDDPEVRDMVLPALRADYRALAGHVGAPGPRLRLPFTVLIGDRDPVVTVDEAAAWHELTAADAELLVFEGGHFYLDDHLDDIARIVGAALTGPARAVAPDRPSAYAGTPHTGSGGTWS
ncbi:alpha/beta fold hydrolase [Streptomyces sp. NPDC026672]|uniref:thioesterase II family protein n=1 Tax=unclassified Streptomyces TaxID=2593676 RepID=UPI0033CF0666